jgi:alkylation response protein AidB-like acyl-CoA dehydrogenase
VELLLNEQQALLAETAARLCRAAGGPVRARALRDGGVELDAEAWRRMVGAGWPGMTAAEPHGGLGLGLFEAALAIEQAGRHLLMTPLCEAAAVSWTLSRAAAGKAAPPALASLVGGDALIVPATEPPHWRFGARRSDADLEFDPRAISLTGAVAFVPFARPANLFLVATNAGNEPLLALVDGAAEGLAETTRGNVDGSTATTLTFDNVAVAAEFIVTRGETASRLAAAMQDALALLASAELLGLAAAAHEMTVDYLKLRQQFGRPIGSFQALQHRAVNGMVDIELNRSLIYRVLADFDRGAHHPAMISAVKARAARVALEVVRAALQMHGAVGYTDSHDIGLYYKRAIVLASRYGGEIGHTAHFSELTLA